MQTFLPYIGEFETTRDLYDECAGLLSPRHVGEQRVMNLVIMTELVKFPGEPISPGVAMWRGYEWSLLQYQEAICDHWIENLGGSRDPGGEDSYYDITHRLYFENLPIGEQFQDPPWLGDEALALSHQSNLIRKDPKYYQKCFPGVPNDLPYIWPVQ